MDKDVIIFCCLVVIFILIALLLLEHDKFKAWKDLSKILAEDCAEKDKVISQQQKWLSEKDGRIRVMKNQLKNNRDTITWYQARTRIGGYYIDEYVEKKLAPDLKKLLEGSNGSD